MLQEVRADPDELSFFIKFIPGYNTFFNPSKRPGWSGTAIYYKNNINIEEISKNTGNEILDSEGRTIFLRLPNNIFLFNFYTPNGGSSEERLKFKLKFYTEILKHLRKLLKDESKVIIGGDLNVAYEDIDIHPDLSKQLRSCILPEERTWFRDILKLGFLDTFRLFNKEDGNYTWWHMKDLKRRRNRGIRFDYFLVTRSLKEKVQAGSTEPTVFGSDHCPVTVEMDL